MKHVYTHRAFKLRFYSVDDWMHNGLAISVFQYVNISIFSSHLIFVIQMYRYIMSSCVYGKTVFYLDHTINSSIQPR